MFPSSFPPPHLDAPRIWLLLGDKLGDNAQVRTVAAALALPSEERLLSFKPRYEKFRPAFKAGFGHVDPTRSADIAAPWPDLVITSGRRPAAAALWIKEQSGGRTKVVIIGRPHRKLEDFDLVVAPPQFSLPARPNIIAMTSPLFSVEPSEIAEQVRLWAPALADMPRPLTAILLGGPQPPFRFNATVALAILDAASKQSDGGSLIILTSRRTPPGVTRALARSLPANAKLFPWTSDKNANPYRAVLGIADRFVVTGDSISMIGEVLSLGKSLAIATAPLSRQPHVFLEYVLAQHFRAANSRSKSIWSLIKRHLHAKGVLPFARDFAGFHDNLVQRGAAVFLGTPFPQTVVPSSAEFSVVAARIRDLLTDTSAAKPPR